MCYNSPGPRCAGHTRTLYRETKQALVEANAKLEQAKQELSEANDTQAEAQLIHSEKLLKLAQANHDEATEKYDASKAVRAEKMEAYRIARDNYLESAEGIQALRDAGKTDEAEKYATIREMKLAELKRVEAAKADIANGAIKAVIEMPVVKQEAPDLTGKSLNELESMTLQDDITPETLEAMLSVKMDYEWDENQIKQIVARHESASIKTLDHLSRENDSDVRGMVALNPSAHPDTLAGLVEDPSRYVRSYIAENPSTSAITLSRLAKDEESTVRQLTAGNSNTPDHVLSELAHDDEGEVAAAALNNIKATHQMMRDAVTKHAGYGNKVHDTLGKRDDLPSDVLSSIATKKNQYALRNPALSVETMKSIVSGEDAAGAYHIASNPSLPIELMEGIMQDKDKKTNPYWRKALALNPSAPGHMLASLYGNDTRDQLMQNPATPEFVYEKMAKSPDYKFRVELAKSETLPETVLLSLRYTDKSKQVRDATRVNRRYAQAQ